MRIVHFESSNSIRSMFKHNGTPITYKYKSIFAKFTTLNLYHFSKYKLIYLLDYIFLLY